MATNLRETPTSSHIFNPLGLTPNSLISVLMLDRILINLPRATILISSTLTYPVIGEKLCFADLQQKKFNIFEIQ